MTTYTTTAIATSSTDNTVTVASISNMVPGLPITFSGITFGGITTGSTYYIGTITYGYPTSKITLTSLPGGAVFTLTTATGSMTANWSSGGQQLLITVPPGENLNTAFTKINTNFDQIWAAGPVNSNIKISENTIYTLDTNGDLILNPNGIGNVVANAHVVPDTTLIRNLGSPTKVWNEAYINYLEVGNLTPTGLTIPVGNLHILGGNANTFLKTDGSGNLSWSLPVAAAGGNDTQVQYNNNGVLDGSDAFIFTSNTSTVTIQNVTTTGVANLNYVGNVQIAGGVSGYVLTTDGLGNLNWTAPTGNIHSILDQQIYGDGSTVDFTLITPSVTNAVIVAINGVMQIPDVAYTVATDIITFAEPPLSTDLVDIRFLIFGEAGNTHPSGAEGFIQFNSSGSFGGSGNLKYISSTGNLYSANVSVSGNITASYYYGDGSHLTGVTATANTGTITFSNNIISTSNANAAINILGPQSTPLIMAAGGNTATGQLLWSTNIGALLPDQINNGVLNGNTWGTQISVGNTGAVIGSNSVAGLHTWIFKTDGTLSGAGGVVAGNITSTTDVTATANISAVGNVVGTYILGNVAFATGIPQSYSNSNVYALLDGSAADIIPLANVSYSLGNATNQWKDLWVSNSTIYINSVPLTVDGNTLQIANANVVTYSASSNTDLSISGNIISGGNVVTTGTGGDISGSGNITGAYFFGNGSQLTGIVSSANTGNVTFDNINIIGDGNLHLQPDPNNSSAFLDIYLTTGPDIHIAGNSENVIIGRDEGANIQIGADGNVTIQSWDGNSILWKFGNDGILQLPAGNLAGLGNVTGPGNITYPFGPGPILLADTSANNSAYFALTAVANADGVLGYVGMAQFGSNTSTGLIETTDSDGTINNWYFNQDGTTTFPGFALPNVDGSSGQVLTTWGNGQVYWNTSSGSTGNITFDNSTIVGPSFGDVPSANSSVYIQPTVDSANVFQFGADGNITASNNLGLVTNSNLWMFDTNGALTFPGNTLQIGLVAGNSGLVSQNAANITIDTTSGGNLNSTWTFGTDGELYLPFGGRLGVAGKNWTGLDGGNGSPVSLTSFYANGFYAGCVTNNNDGNIIVSTYTGDGLQGNWTFDNGANLVLAPTNQEINGTGSGESAKFRGTRRIVGGYTNSYAYSTVLAAGGTPTVAYTATDNSVMSAKITFAVEGANGVWEQFDVSAVIDSTGNDVNFTVSNRVKRDNAIPDTVVTAAMDGGDRITISLNLDASQSAGWSSFDAVEFGLMAG